MKIGILEPDHFSNKAIAELSKIGTVECFDGSQIEAFVSDKEVLFVRLHFQISSVLLKSAVRLKYICSPTTGLNHIDTGYCSFCQIQILSLKGETAFLKSIRATPEHTLGLLIAVKRHYNKAFLNSKRDEWNRDLYRGYEIYGSCIGIIGLGRVGKILSQYLNAMGAQVGYYDIANKRTPGYVKRYNSVSELISNCDTVILSSSFSPGQELILGRQEINAMKDKYFINTARAELCDESYLSQKALEGHFKGIAVDVIQNEQSVKSHLKTWLNAADLHNVIITPHIGGATYTSMARTEEFITNKLLGMYGIGSHK